MSTVLCLFVVDKVQPKTASYLSLQSRSGMITRPGSTLGYLGLLPTAGIETALDIALKSNNVKPATLQLDGRAGFLILQSDSAGEMRDALDNIVKRMDLQGTQDSIEVVNSRLISHIDHYQAYVTNRMKMGSLCIPGQSLYVLECLPSGYAVAAANEAEKAADINIVDFRYTGSMGRIMISGEDSQLRAARDAALDRLGT